MRKLLAVLTLSLTASLALAANLQTVVLDVKNMNCPACSLSIDKTLSRVTGVSKHQVDSKAATVTVSFDAERTSISELERAITDAGFPAKARKQDG